MIYNIEHFRLRYVGVCSALKVAAALLFFLDWVLVSWSPDRKPSAKEKPLGHNVGELVSSIISLDRLSAMGESPSLEQVELIDSSSGSGSPDSDYNSNDSGSVDDDVSSGRSVTGSVC